jgi:hypothetical protein
MKKVQLITIEIRFDVAKAPWAILLFLLTLPL